ncbi:F-box protein CPR1-like [Silene latifolia]|uniref:F-box protein CPR1-like n=1 Tax=Silene latifolia TaxID=37657 RepID=UPI003D7850A3
MHLKHNYGCRNNCLLAQYSVTPAGEIEPELLWFGESDESNIIQDCWTLETTLPSDNYICGPSYGIYYSWNSDYRFDDCESSSWYYPPRCLWNPALNEIKKLPPMIKKPNLSSNLTYHKEFCGFGFDPVTVDFKVVAIMGYKKLINDKYGETYLDYPLSIMIYSLKSDSWRYSGDLSKSYYLRPNSCYAFVNRSFYWLGSDKEFTSKSDVIIAIDLATEECQEIGLPEARIKGSITYNTYSECLMVCDDSIGLVTLYDNYKFEIWTLNGRIWSDEYSVVLDCWVWKPIGHYCVTNNLVSFDSPKGLILCDPDTDETWKIKVITFTDYGVCETLSAYMESLVPLNDRDFWEKGTSIKEIKL